MNIKSKDLTVEKLIQYAVDESVWLPEFQRPYVWDDSQIRLLIDSLFHDYTISSILLWQGADELARRRVGGSIKEIKLPQIKSSENITYLLDGQQRTTTLMYVFTEKKIFKGNNTVKTELVNLYWDSDYKGDNPEQRWVFDDEPLVDENGIKLEALSQAQIFAKYGSRFVRLKHAYNWTIVEPDILKDVNKDYKQLYEYKEKVNELKQKILDRRVLDIEQKGKLEEVLEVFERINTKNTKLSIFDIMVAKTYRKNEDQIFDLRTLLLLMNYRGVVNRSFFKNKETLDLNKVVLRLREGDLLPVISIMLNQQFNQNDILKVRAEDLIENCKLLHDKFTELIDSLDRWFGIKEAELSHFLPYIKFFSAFLVKIPKIDLSEQEFVVRWFWNTLLYNRYPGSQNERIARDYRMAIASNQYTTTLEKMRSDNSRSFHDIENALINSPKYFNAYYSSQTQQYYRALTLLLKSKGARDFYSGLEPIKRADSGFETEEHHIFPDNSIIGKQIKARYKDSPYEELINNIANIALITRTTNNNRISNRNPSDYIDAFEKEYVIKGKGAEFVDIMESQFINADAITALKKDDFETFLFCRTQELMKQIHTLCKF